MTETLTEPAVLPAPPRERVARAELTLFQFRLGVAACAVAVAVFVLLQRFAWPPHEDETLALFVGRSSFRDLFHVVLGQRGGAPLHFLLAWVVAHLGGGLGGLRLVSAIFAIASVPAIALLGGRLAGRTVGLVTAVLAAGTWVLLFHGIYGRMYSLFLCLSALSYLALLRALDRGGRRAWALWGAAILLTVATHPYGALVLGSQGLYLVLRRTRLREATIAFVAVLVLATPFWRTDFVLAGRFDVGVGRGGAKLNGPASVLRYLRYAAGDFSAGWGWTMWIALALAALGLVLLARRRSQGALLAACVFATPTLAFLVARFGNSTSPETRHLIFALPFFSLLLAMPLVALGRSRLPLAPVVAAIVLAAFVSTEVAWARHKTPPLFAGEPQARIDARHAASAWLAATGRRDDVLFGYDPLFLDAWEQGGAIPRVVVPRADAKLAVSTLRGLDRPLGRGVWVFDASDTNNVVQQQHIRRRVPAPQPAFEARVFGPFLVIRTRETTGTPQRFLDRSAAVMAVGKALFIGDADINLHTVLVALGQLRSRSTTSR